MALGKYFSKDLLAIHKVISTSPDLLEEKLNNTVVGIAFDKNAIETLEGQKCLDLLIRLLSRFYPVLKIINLSEGQKNYVELKLSILAKKINSNISLVGKEVTESILIVVGKTEAEIETTAETFFLGSDNWLSYFSQNKSKSFSNSSNPFGCGFSAILAASNIFRNIFHDELNGSDIDEDLTFSTFSLEKNNVENPPLEEVFFEDVVIAGLGAIGNGLIWGLANFPNLSGNLDLVDPESIALTNLQRYVMLTENQENQWKAEISPSFFPQPKLKVKGYTKSWDKYSLERNKWKIDCVAVGVDNIKDRIGIQSSLPKVLLNAFTEPETVGLSRHYDFVEYACLVCSNIPLSKIPSYLENIAESCKIPEHIFLLRQYYDNNISVDQIIIGNSINLLNLIGIANKISEEQLKPFHGMYVQQFYGEFICGGQILKMTNSTTQELDHVDAPLAFQSAMAGLLLAIEVIRYNIKQPRLTQRTDFYPLAAISSLNPLHRSIEKDVTGKCICVDSDFLARYKSKYIPSK